MSSPAAAAYAMPLMPFRQFSQHERPMQSPAAADGPLVVIPPSMAHLSRAKQHANEELAKRQLKVRKEEGDARERIGRIKESIENTGRLLTLQRSQLEQVIAKLELVHSARWSTLSKQTADKMDAIYQKATTLKDFFYPQRNNGYDTNTYQEKLKELLAQQNFKDHGELEATYSEPFRNFLSCATIANTVQKIQLELEGVLSKTKKRDWRDWRKQPELPPVQRGVAGQQLVPIE